MQKKEYQGEIERPIQKPADEAVDPRLALRDLPGVIYLEKIDMIVTEGLREETEELKVINE